MNAFRLACRFAAVVLASASSLVMAQTVHVTTTSADLKQALQSQPELQFAVAPADAFPLVIEVDATKRFQQIDGFGASLTDSAAWLLETKLDADTRHQAMRALFDRGEGIGLSILRQPMGGSDLAREHYTYDDLPAGSKDFTLAHFSIAHDEAELLPALREALSLNPGLKIIATPWSAPAWMKSSNSLIKGKLNRASYPAFAQYFVKYLEAYRAAGVPIWAVTLQNEPLFQPKDYMGMGMSAEQQKELLRDYVGPAFEKAGLDTKIMVYDHNWDKPSYPATILNDAKAAHYAAGTAYHCYAGNVSAQSLTHTRFPAKDIWETECSGGKWQKDHAFQQTAELVIGTTRNWSRSVVLWGLALDPQGNPHAGGCDTCRGVITVDASTQPAKFEPTVDYYVLGQASKFVVPGAYRIASTDLEAKDLSNVAFLNADGSVVLLVLNKSAGSVTFDVHSESKTLRYTLTGSTMATFYWHSQAQDK